MCERWSVRSECCGEDQAGSCPGAVAWGGKTSPTCYVLPLSLLARGSLPPAAHVNGMSPARCPPGRWEGVGEGVGVFRKGQAAIKPGGHNKTKLQLLNYVASQASPAICPKADDMWRESHAPRPPVVGMVDGIPQPSWGQNGFWRI